MSEPKKPKGSIAIHLVTSGGGIIENIHTGGAVIRGFDHGIIAEAHTGGIVRNITAHDTANAPTSNVVTRAELDHLRHLIEELKRNEQNSDHIQARQALEKIANGDQPTTAGLESAKKVATWISGSIQTVGAQVIAAMIKQRLGLG